MRYIYYVIKIWRKKTSSIYKFFRTDKTDEPSKNKLQDNRFWLSVKTDPAGYLELIKNIEGRISSRKTRNAAL